MPAFENELECKHCAAAAYYLMHDYFPGQGTNEDRPALENEYQKGAKVIPLVDTNPSIVTFKNISNYEIYRIVQNHYYWEYYSVKKCTLLEVSGSRHYFSYVESAKKKYLQEVNFYEPDSWNLSVPVSKRGAVSVFIFLLL